MRLALLAPLALLVAAACGSSPASVPDAGAPPDAVASPDASAPPDAAAPPDGGAMSQGELIFRRDCASCHGFGQGGARRGPDLFGVTARRPRMWLEHWLDDPAAVAAQNPYAQQLVAQWGGVVMPDPGLDALEIAAVLDFLAARAAIGPLPMTPPVALSEADAAAMRAIYFDRCAGCHGTLRAGATGPSLAPARAVELGTDALAATIRHGRPWGMPAWGDEGILDEVQVTQLAAFLQAPVPPAPAWSLDDARASWQVIVPVDDRPTAPAHDRDWENFFGVILRDAGEVAIYDGATREELARIDTGFASHILRASSTGRYFTAVGRDGWLTLIDLWASPPRAVAQARGCYDARSVEGSKHPGYEDRYAIEGCYWPSQYVVFDGLTLEPLAVHDVRGPAVGTTEPVLDEVRVAAIVAVPGEPAWALALKESGHVAIVDYTAPGLGVIARIDAVRFLHDGGLDHTGRYFLAAANAQHAIAVIDLQARALVTTIATGQLPHPGRGANWQDPVHGWVNATTHLGEPTLAIYGADPAARPDVAWQVVREVPTAASGSLFLKTHPASPWVLFDMALSTEPTTARQLCAFAKATAEVHCFDVSTTGPALQPEFDRTGSEVWVSVWHEQGEIVILDAVTLAEKARITGLDNPTGKFNVWNTAHDVY